MYTIEKYKLILTTILGMNDYMSKKIVTIQVDVEKDNAATQKVVNEMKTTTTNSLADSKHFVTAFISKIDEKMTLLDSKVDQFEEGYKIRNYCDEEVAKVKNGIVD